MTDKPARPPVLESTPRPVVPERMEAWLETADAIRKAREAEWGADQVARDVERIEHRYRSGK